MDLSRDGGCGILYFLTNMTYYKKIFKEKLREVQCIHYKTKVCGHLTIAPYSMWVFPKLLSQFRDDTIV